MSNAKSSNSVNEQRKKYFKAAKNVIYLCSCVLKGIAPSGKRVSQMDIGAVYSAAEAHLLTSMTASALESAGVYDDRFTQAKAKAIRKNALLDIDREALLERLEEAKIWYMPLKGAIIKDMYPSYGMRQMSDNDILFDPDRAADVKQIMSELGFTCKSFGRGSHDVYHKLPVSNFEMHTSLFSDLFDKNICKYYSNIKSKLIKDTDSSFGYHFSDNDLYIYLTAHEFKHYSNGGTGLRSVIDTYIYLSDADRNLDMDRINAECRRLGIAEFEQKNRSLALHLFGTGVLTDEDKAMLKYVILSGTYGTISHSVENRVVKNGGKLGYILSRIFVTPEQIKSFYPLFWKYKLLLPLLPFYRAVHGLTVNRKRILAEIRTLIKHP